MTPFAPFYERAVARHGEDELRARLPRVVSAEQLAALPDDRYLAAMAERVFAAGFRWRVIKAKWEGFEEAFQGFDPAWVADLDIEGVAALAQDTRIVRNRPKILATIDNAAFVRQVSAEHGSFGAWLAAWPAEDTIGLWAALKAGGNRLGGDTGPWVLRMVGRDTFRLSSDVVAALIEAGVVTKKPTGKRDLARTQEAFNAWSTESGLTQGAVSVVLACSTGEIYQGR